MKKYPKKRKMQFNVKLEKKTYLEEKLKKNAANPKKF